MKKNKIPSCRVESERRRERRNTFEKIHLNLKEFEDKVDEFDNIYNYMRWAVSIINDKSTLYEPNTILYENLITINDMIGDIWVEKHNKHFSLTLPGIIDIKNYTLPDYIEKDNISNIFDNIGDCMINIKNDKGEYLPFIIDLHVSTFLTKYGKYEDQPTIVISVIDINTCNPLCCFYVIKDVFPKIFIDRSNMYTPNCKENQYCIDANIAYKEKESYDITKEPKYNFEHNLCSMTKKRSDWGYCPYMEFKPYMLLDIITHVWNMYLNRKTVVRKNSKRREAYEKSQVSAIMNNDDYKLIPVHDIYKYERAERKEHQGGHHSSPVEHDRKPHMRRIFNSDGTLKKIIPVRGSRVNKGGKKAIYIIESNN